MEKKRLYLIGVLLSYVLLFGTAGASDLGMITFFESVWQIIIALLGGLWWWNLWRIETIRVARKRF